MEISKLIINADGSAKVVMEDNSLYQVPLDRVENNYRYTNSSLKEDILRIAENMGIELTRRQVRLVMEYIEGYSFDDIRDAIEKIL